MANRNTTSRSITVRVPLADYKRLMASGEPISPQVIAAIRLMLDDDQRPLPPALVQASKQPEPPPPAEVSKEGVSDILANMALGRLPDALMRDRRQAAVDLAKLHGWMVDRAQVRVINGPEDLSDDELNNLIEGIRRRLEER